MSSASRDSANQAAAICNAVAAKLNPLFPSKDQLENREIVSLLVFLDSPTIVGRVVPLLATTTTMAGPLATEKVLARNEGYAKAAQDMANSRPNRQAIAYAFAAPRGDRWLDTRSSAKAFRVVPQHFRMERWQQLQQIHR
jgi:hypothetical protein